MRISRGKKHDFLGMTLDYSTPKVVQITMFPYVKEVVEDFAKYDPGKRVAATPGINHLFKVDDDSPPLSKKQAEIFHGFVAKLLFLMKRARPDIATAISYLTTRVKVPNEDDWSKLARVVCYLYWC